MIDINNIISLALTSAINKAIEPLITRIAALESANDILHRVQGERIDTLEKNEEALVQRIAALETNPAGTPATITADAFVTHLDNQEWFWEKLQGRIDATAERWMDDHTSSYDHDEYDNHINDDDKHFDGDIEDAVRDALNGTSVTLSF